MLSPAVGGIASGASSAVSSTLGGAGNLVALMADKRPRLPAIGLIDERAVRPADPSAAAERAIARLDGFARGLGIDDLTVRPIVEAVIAGMPDGSDDERLAEARRRMLRV